MCSGINVHLQHEYMYENEPSESHGLTPGGFFGVMSVVDLIFKESAKPHEGESRKLTKMNYFKVAPAGVKSLIVGTTTIMMMMK